MNKIYEALKNKKAFIPFITCGDPDVATTRAAILEMVKNGADLVEIGIPFSDPTAEGVVIQGANIRALEGGITTDKVFDMVADLRDEVTVPLVFMTYANVVFSYGPEKFFAKCKEIGIDALYFPISRLEREMNSLIFLKNIISISSLLLHLHLMTVLQ